MRSGWDTVVALKFTASTLFLSRFTFLPVLIQTNKTVTTIFHENEIKLSKVI